ncbi:MAG TPA: hypothetical protein PKL15_19760, partial [Saprospiraceae bacterium]|nr:hypothetical protein [Saprospiraceae bacterium]
NNHWEFGVFRKTFTFADHHSPTKRIQNKMDDFAQTPPEQPAFSRPAESLAVTPTLRKYWSEISKWALFFAILGFIYLLFLLIIVVLSSQTGILGLSFVFVIVGTLVFFPTWFTFQFSQRLKRALAIDSNSDLDEGFENLKRFYMFVGVLMIIILSLYLIAFLTVFSLSSGVR